MAQNYYFSAPGSVMLMGEHVVLHGGHAMVAAIDQRIQVILTPRQDQEIHIKSDRLGECISNIYTIEPMNPFEFVLTAITHFKNELTQGFDLSIRSEFAETLGLGSSAAVTVAVIGVLATWLRPNMQPLELYQLAKQTIVHVQGMGSGADAAASVYGGLVAYRIAPFYLEPLPIPADISLVYCGYKTPTKKVIAMVAEQHAQFLQLYTHLYTTMDSCAKEAILACQQQRWAELGQLMDFYQGLQHALGVSNSQINTLVAELRQQPGILGAKISGSGLGDCIIGLGKLADNQFPQNIAQQQMGVQQLSVKISPKACGVMHEKQSHTH